MTEPANPPTGPRPSRPEAYGPLATARVARRCHLPAWIPLLGGTAPGAVLRTNFVPVPLVMGALFLLALTRGLWMPRECDACEVAPAGGGGPMMLRPLVVALPLVLVAIAGCTKVPTVTEPNAPSAGPGTLSSSPSWAFNLPEAGPTTLVASRDGSTLAAAVLQGAAKGGTLYVLDAATGHVRINHTYPFAMCCTFPPVALDPVGSHVLVGGNSLQLLDVNSGAVLAAYDLPRDTEKFPEVPVNVDLSPGGRLGAAATWKANYLVALTPETAPLWETRFPGNKDFAEVHVTADGSGIVLASPGRVARYDAQTGSLDAESLYSTTGSAMPGLAISQDGTRFATVARLADGLAVLVFGPGSSAPRWHHALAQNEYWGGVYMSPEGTLVAAWSPGESYVFDGEGRTLLNLGSKARIHAFVPADVGSLLLVSRGGTLEVLHVAKTFQRSLGGVPFEEGYATLTASGVVTATTLSEGGRIVGTRLAGYAIPNLPVATGGGPHDV